MKPTLEAQTNFARENRIRRTWIAPWRFLLRNALVSSFAAFLSVAAIAKADTVSFVGTRHEELPAASAGGRCDPVPTLIVNSTIGIATGQSDFGAFTANQSACLNTPFPAPITDGFFTWTFADGDSLSGTLSGLATRTITPAGRILTLDATYLITGGTGTFFDASGSFFETGTGTSTGTSAIADYTFSGSVAGPNITPEPAPFFLLGAGLGCMTLGLTMRRRRLLINRQAHR